MTSEIRVRYAPSPTGHLHIGGARTALFTYLFARRHGGTFLLRIEDTDLARNVTGAAEEFYNGLRWLDINWDEGEDIGGPYGPYRCTERLDIYRSYTNQLLQEDKAYPCYCSEEDMEREREEMTAKGLTPKYSGHCRHLTAEQREAHEQQGRSKTIRLRASEGEALDFDDLVRGPIHFESDGNDFVIVKSNAMPTYNLQVVIDDHLMRITHVTRGEEHISNTPRQILIYRAFGWDVPRFAHFNLILNTEGKKLSKRDESILQFISQYRDMGCLPEAILNFLALLGWSPGTEQEIFTKEEIIAQFGFDRVNKSGSIFDLDKLTWMNNHYMKTAELDRVVNMAVPHLQKGGYMPSQLSEAEHDWVVRLVALVKDQLHFAGEIVSFADVFFRDTVQVDEEAKAMLDEEYAPVVLASFRKQVEQADVWTPEAVGPLLKQVQAETGYKGKQLFMTVRVALTGQMHGPDLNQSIYLLGKEKVLGRLTRS